jgi:predicted nucleic acid-binding Zn ribbon protein
VTDERPKGKPSSIGDALASFLKESGLDARVGRARVLMEWSAIVGAQIAGVTVPRTLTEDGTLFVGVRTHGWMQELSMMERTLVARINAHPGPAAVKRIRWELLR